MSEKRFLFHQFSTNSDSLSGIQFRNPFNSRIIVWEIEKSEESPRVLGWVCQCLSDRRAHFPHFHFHPRRDFSQSFPARRFLCIFISFAFSPISSLISRIQSEILPSSETTLLTSVNIFSSNLSLLSVHSNTIFRWKEISARLRLLFSWEKSCLSLLFRFMISFILNRAKREAAVVDACGEWKSNEFPVYSRAEAELLHVPSLTIDWFSPIYHWHYHHLSHSPFTSHRWFDKIHSRSTY